MPQTDRDTATSHRRLDRIRRPRVLRLLAWVLLVAGCVAADTPARRVVIASTTSTEDSGLFDVLIPAFEAANPGYDGVVVAVGSGEALALGRRKDADVLLVHSPAAESTFVAEGYGSDRREVMTNDFVIVGPAADPAGIAGSADAAAALERIASARAPFVSRGDDSGTHARERLLWRTAGIVPAGEWYREVGQGMGAVLQIASESGAYTLTDRGSYLFLREGLALDVLVEGDARLLNHYSVIRVAGARNADGAAAFHRWILGPDARALIRDYGRGRFDHPLFVPAAAPR